MHSVKTHIFPIVIYLIFSHTHAYAESEASTLYENARKAYNANNCTDAVPMLIKYKEINKNYLSSHQNIKISIDNAIKYCEQYTASCVGKASGSDPNYKGEKTITLEPPSKRNLPK